MSNTLVTIPFGALRLHCHLTCWTKADNGLGTSLNQVVLEARIAEDLAPDPRATRPIEIDITEVLRRLGAISAVKALALAAEA